MQNGFGSSLGATSVGDWRLPFDVEIAVKSVSFQDAVSHSGRVRTESDSTSEYLPPVLSNQPDSSDRGHGRKTQLDRHHVDDTWGIVATALDAWVDVTGAV